MCALLMFDVALIVAGWIWQTHNALGAAPGRSWFSSR